MTEAQLALERLIYDRLIPEFCSDPSRGLHTSGFRKDSLNVSECDARDFLRAFDRGLIEHQGRGTYRASRSAANEQFFWEGWKSKEPRRFSLFVEPIITVAALARLHFTYGWPKDLIAAQSLDWAFDVVAFLPGHPNEHIAGEVKKTFSEVEGLIALMHQFASDSEIGEPAGGRPRNAWKKVTGLRARRAPVFWAVGPDGLSKVFKVEYRSNEIVELIPSEAEALYFRRA